jgi:hypothetical protein
MSGRHRGNPVGIWTTSPRLLALGVVVIVAIVWILFAVLH